MDENCIKKDLYEQGLPVIEADIPYVQSILFTVQSAQASLKRFPGLFEKVPITIFDERVRLWRNSPF